MKDGVFRKPRLFDLACGAGSGLMLFLSFHPADLSFLSWVAVVPILLLAARGPGRAAIPAYVGGAIWFLGGLEWARHATLPGMILLGLFMALYLAAFALAAGILRQRLKVPLAILAPVLWVTLEAIRSNIMTGFPYLLLGHTQIDNLALMQILDITGVYGVSFVIMSCNGLLADVILARKARSYKPAAVSAAIAAAALGCALIYGHRRLGTVKILPGPEVCLVQVNTPQDVKNTWTYEAAGYAMQKYIKSTYYSLQAAEDPGPLVIWPESALPGCYNNLKSPLIYSMRSSLNGMLRANGIRRLLIGMNSFKAEGDQSQIFNSAIYFDGRHDKYERYDKIHLVPFGEYVPLSRLLFFVKGIVPYEQAFSAGSDYKLFDYNGHTFAVVICYEDVFPGLVRRFVAEGAEFVVNISNEGWFYESAEADQHLAIARCRAIENRIGVVRSTNSGISCLIDPVGRVSKKIVDKAGKAKLVEGWLTGRVSLGDGGATIYTRFGDLFAVLCIAGSIGLAATAVIRARRDVRRAAR